MKKLLYIFPLLLFWASSMEAQKVANWGLTHSQSPATMPQSRAVYVSPIPKQQHPLKTELKHTGINDYTLAQGWRLTSNHQLISSDISIFAEECPMEGWYNATVPGTVLTTLVDQGVYPDPYYGLNNLQIPDTLCRMDWWYRLEFASPAPIQGKEAWLLFNGINYQAEVWLNKVCLGTIKGAFTRGEFNVTEHLKEKGNVLAIHILPPPNPGIPHEQSAKGGVGMNGGQLCLDGPTFISSEGWDWVPGIRDRNIGIWQDVHLRFTEGVRLNDTQVISHLELPDTTAAELTIHTEVENVLSHSKQVSVNLDIEGISLSQTVTLEPYEKKKVTFTPKEYHALNISSPRLWWPNNYGSQELYTMDITVTEQGKTSDAKQIRFGIRELSYEMEVCLPDDEIRRIEFRPTTMLEGKPIFDNINRKYVEGGMCMPRLNQGISPDILIPAPDSLMRHYLVVKVNGKRIFCKGGNWGMDDGMKRVSREHLEPYFRLHKEANFNMIRNWTGESTEEIFYDLCDEYGMLVFNDFWLTTQGYNLPPNDDDLFIHNARDVVKRFRNHPSIAIWNPRNEGFAPEYIEKQLAAMTAEEDGTRYYSPNSTHINLRGSGPWKYHKEPIIYYKDLAHGFNTEQGSTSIPTEESILAMMDEKDAWPIGDVWNYHDFHNGQRDFMEDMEQKLGKAESLKDFVRKAQLLNYNSHRAMLEAWNSKMWNSTSGLLLWMSHPAWPSMIWQTYSWDYETFGSFYGCRKACEPIHIQKNLDDNKVVVVNTSLKKLKGAKMKYEIYSLEGKRLFERTIKTDITANGLTEGFVQELPQTQTGICMERLTLMDNRGRIISVNEYWQKNGQKDFKAFNTLPKAKITGKIIKRNGNRLEIEVRNIGLSTALSLKLNARDNESGKRILPAYCTEGYFHLLPGEKKTVTIEYIPQGKSHITIEGYNLPSIKLLTI